MLDQQSAAGSDNLTERLRFEILRHLRDDAPSIGTPLTERGLAEKLGVSRSPVRRALQELRESGFVSRTETGRYQVARSGEAVGEIDEAGSPGEEIYLRVAADRLDGVLPDRVTENALSRRYGLTRARVAQLLLRLSREGWIEPLPGYGWRLLPVLTSLRSYTDSYRFRLTIEPAAILEPTFVLDRAAIERRRAQQRELVEGGVHSVRGAELFDLNSGLHETIIQCSNNDFFVEALTRINKVRRLIEYRQALVPERARIRCVEHVRLADLLLDGRNREASEFLRAHLSTVLQEKTAA